MNEPVAKVSGHGMVNMGSRPDAILNAIPHPVLIVSCRFETTYCNDAAEQFFHASKQTMRKHRFDEILTFSSPLVTLIQQVCRSLASVNEYGIALSSPRFGERAVDVQVVPVGEPRGSEVLVILQERTMADKMDRQLTHRAAARSVVGMASILAHEIKNPLSGIRGAAQLLEPGTAPDERNLIGLICNEVDRIRQLVDRMEVFSDERPVPREPVNIHEVLGHVVQLAASGFAKDVQFWEHYDPSLPPVMGDKNQLIQVFLNLVKNAEEAIRDTEGEIMLSTAFRPGVHLSVPGAGSKVGLPLEICVIDNGPGVRADVLEHLFDPFVTTRASGTGLGLALVAKIIGAHGGVVECDTLRQRTVFRVLLPVHDGTPAKPVKNSIPAPPAEKQE